MKWTVRCLVLLGMACMLCLPLAAADKADAAASDLIKDGWKEYQYREFSSAAELFRKAADKATENKDKLQALTGQAFCYQFGPMALATSGDYSNAIAIYKQALALAGEDRKYVPFFKSMIAECTYRIYMLTDDEDKYKEACDIWAELQKDYPNTVAAQEGLLFQTIMDTKTLKGDDNKDRMQTISARIAAKPSGAEAADANALLPVMANYMVWTTYWNGDYKGAVHWLKEYLKIGPTNYSAKVTTVFRIARTSELKNKDLKEAIEYYALFAKSFPTSGQRYFAEQKVIELKKALEKQEAGK